MKTCGIYGIENTLDGKKYIGGSKWINRRWWNHLSMLHRGVHDNEHLQTAWDKDGEAAFRLVVIEACELSELRRIEEKYIAQSLYPVGYNMRPTADTRMQTEEIKRKIGRANRGKRRSEEQKAALRRGWTVEARARLSKSKSGAGNAQFGKPLTPEHKAQISKAFKGKARPECSHVSKTRIPVGQFDKSGNLIVTYLSLTHAAKAIGSHSGEISLVVSGKRKTCKGFVFKRV